ncbi:MAG: group III truncated hemoglobin [Myxococcota bacterium]
MNLVRKNQHYAIPRGSAASQGIDAEKIAKLVTRFYEDVRNDPELGPIFERRIAGDWDPHLDKMRRFWRTILLAEGSYRGNPMAVHQQLDGLTPDLFGRWITLFTAAAEDTFAPEPAKVVLGKATRMARALSQATGCA